ncbi:MAG: ABC transporter ATP-binding protein [Janthinobacterium lividum]
MINHAADTTHAQVGKSNTRTKEPSFQRRYLAPEAGRLLLLALFLAASIAAQIINPLIMRHFIDAAQTHSPLSVLTRAALLFLSLALLFQITAVAETYVAELVGWRVTNQMRSDLTRHCLSLDMSFHKAHLPGEMIERIDGDVSTLSNYFSRLVVSVGANVLLALGILVAIVCVNPPIGLCVLGLLVVGTALLLPAQKRGAAAAKASRQASSDQFGFIEERIYGAEDIRACGATGYTLGRLYPLMRALYETTVRSWLLGRVGWAVVNVTFSLAQVTALVIGAYFFLHHRMTLGTLFLLFDYTFLIVGPLEQLANQLQNLQEAGGSLERIQELLETSSALTNTPSPAGSPQSLSANGALSREAPSREALSVELDRVTFGYEADAPVLHDLSFQLAAGRTLGVLGRTGSGKTTLLRLLFRLYDPQGGVVRLGGQILPGLPLSEMRGRIGLVTQDVQIFNASVRDNLTFFNASVGDAKVQASLQEVGLWSWCAALPQGLDTVLESSGMSAGEAQLLSLARVFLKDPDLILFDEFSSRLDPATEASLRHAVDRLLANRTAVIVAHRLETVRRVDEILVLEDGRIQEHGYRAMLTEDSLSHYAKLLSLDQKEDS